MCSCSFPGAELCLGTSQEVGGQGSLAHTHNNLEQFFCMCLYSTCIYRYVMILLHCTCRSDESNVSLCCSACVTILPNDDAYGVFNFAEDSLFFSLEEAGAITTPSSGEL